MICVYVLCMFLHRINDVWMLPCWFCSSMVFFGCTWGAMFVIAMYILKTTVFTG